MSETLTVSVLTPDTADAQLTLLQAWSRAGWLRPLDRELALMLARNAADRSDPLPCWSAAWVSATLAQGHVCLPLAAAVEDLHAWLGTADASALSLTDLLTPAEALRQLLPAAGALAAWRERLARSEMVSGPAGNTPLVLADDRLYLRRYWRYQVQVAAAIRARLEPVATPADLSQRLDELFGDERGSEPDWQRIAAALASRSNFTVISGGPGTGKTTTVVRVLALLQGIALSEQGRPLRIHVAAPTGKAAARLTEAISGAIDQMPEEVAAHLPRQVVTIHRLLRPLPNSRRFRHHASNPLHADVVVVDEASMIDLELMAQLIDALPAHARLILLGDKDQLAAVEAGAVLSELSEGAEQLSDETRAWLEQCTGYSLPAAPRPTSVVADQVALLRKSYRFGADSGIGRLAAAINRGDAAGVREVLGSGAADLVLQLPPAEEGRRRSLLARLMVEGHGEGEVRQPAQFPGYRYFLEQLHALRPAEMDELAISEWAAAVLAAHNRFQLLAPLRSGPWGVESLNRLCADALAAAGLIEPEGLWYEGRPVMVTRNDYSLGLMNGDVGVALRLPSGELRVFFTSVEQGVRSFAPSRLNEVETVYAMTVHKSQGSEFYHAALVLPEQVSPILTRELVYTGVTRARRSFSLVAMSATSLDVAIARRVTRASGLADLLR
ncbi:MAG: exodeoxyribonuclease V subunit alpha [Spongiibacteraceae bacterium]|jgi:exodeoxyribonuclease V alpha subunit|nr:exodeoxyribonuclease V subunit alpha [Spongiibacteraceae bacterium]